MTSASRRVRTARAEMSSRFPIGVPTTARRPVNRSDLPYLEAVADPQVPPVECPPFRRHHRAPGQMRPGDPLRAETHDAPDLEAGVAAVGDDLHAPGQVQTLAAAQRVDQHRSPAHGRTLNGPGPSPPGR